MRRLTIVLGVISLLLYADCAFLFATHYQPGDSNPLFNNSHWMVSDAATVLIAAVLLTVVTAITAVYSRRSGQAGRR
ncbi:MAG TPA: hypothetical protein VN840_20550 [Streptosporangiaceae bacterium]|nr:hypothetical protein [Streptosporangiaceae bacterium]